MTNETPRKINRLEALNQMVEAYESVLKNCHDVIRNCDDSGARIWALQLLRDIERSNWLCAK